jgi:hypothetical protein
VYKFGKAENVLTEVKPNTIYLAYIPEKVMISDNDYINKPER